MPKETFFNLPAAKRERVVEAALEEFATRSYHEARVTAIVDAAGIAKGSFYQYFEDKKDLFRYLMELIVEKKLEYINRHMLGDMQEHSFFALLREAYLSGLRFATEHPRLLAIGIQLQKNQELCREIFGEHTEKSHVFFERLLEKGMAEEELDPDIDVALVARLLTVLNFGLVDLVYEDNEVDLRDMTIIDKMLYVVENGLKRRS